MSLTLHEQAFAMMRRAKRPVIVLPHGAGADGYASAFALCRVFGAWSIPVDVVAADGPTPKTLDFLRAPERVRAAFGALRKFVLTVNVSRAPLDELSYDVDDGQLKIYLTPRDGFWSDADVKTQTSTYRYDLIITLGAASLDALGDLYHKQSAFFFETPLINIDHTPANESFGQVNVVDVTATSCAEVLMELFGADADAVLDEAVSTDLLTGMIAKTQSFKSASVTPKTLKRASALLRHGARREEIVQNLYRTRSVGTLRLWGRVLARLKSDEASGLVWSALSQQDFLLAGADEHELPDVIDELIKNTPAARVVVLLYEDHERHVCGLVSTRESLDSLQVALPFKPVGTRKLARIRFTDKTIVEAEQTVIDQLKKRLAAGTM